MSLPILRTKLHPPPPHTDLVPRPRLLAQLDEGLNQSMTLVAAPAGFGKSTLLSTWLHERNLPLAWLSLDARDSDLPRFLSYILAALRTVHPNLGQGLDGALQTPELPPVELLLTTLLNELAALAESSPRLPAIVLVLDDYHLVHNPDIDQALDFLITQLPTAAGSLHLVIASRVDPALSLPRLRVRRQLNEIRSSDLRFTLEETAALIQQNTGLDLAAEDLNLLEKRTEGWVAGLQLAALSMQDQADVAEFIQAFGGSHRYVMDYLASEVLQQQSPELQAFLVQTSILNRLSIDLCNAVTQRQDSRTILADLEARNLFLIPLDDHRQWYRYHHLFADLLLQHLHQEPTQIPKLHQRAARWYAAQAEASDDLGWVEDALHHFLAANDIEGAVRLVETYREVANRLGHLASMDRWLRILPEEVVRQSPDLCLGKAWLSYFARQFEEMAAWLDAAAACLPPLETITDPDLMTMTGELYLLRAAMMSYQGQAPEAERLLRESRALIPQQQTLAHGLINLFLGFTLTLAYRMEEAADFYRQAIDFSYEANNILATVGATGALTSLHIWQGELQNANQLLESTFRRLTQDGLQTLPAVAELHLSHSNLLYHLNQLDAAEAACHQTLEITRASFGLTILPEMAYLGLTLIDLARGEIETAKTHLAQANESAVEGKGGQILGWARLRVEVALQSGDLATVATWLQRYDTPKERLTTALQIDHQLQSARYHLARFRQVRDRAELDQAETCLQNALNTLADLPDHWRRSQAYLHHALLHEAHGRHTDAETDLMAALNQTDICCVRMFLNEGAPVVAILRRLQQKHPHPDIAHLLAAAGDTAGAGPTAGKPEVSAAPTEAVLLDPLSEREMDVLHLLQSDLSSTDIAEQLTISANTVRSHIKRIYSKLDAHSRYEAIAKARQLNLL